MQIHSESEEIIAHYIIEFKSQKSKQNQKYYMYLKENYKIKFCVNCGKELDDNALFCTNCGSKQNNTTPNENVKQAENIFEAATVDQTNSPQTQSYQPEMNKSAQIAVQTIIPEHIPEQYIDKKPKKKMSKKKKIIIIISIIILLAIITGAVFIVKNIIDTKRYENEYYEELYSTYESIINNADSARSYCELEEKVWRNSIYKNDSYETNSYTKDNYGYFYSDFNDALISFYSGNKSTKSMIELSENSITASIGELNQNTPEKYKEQYDSIKKLYTAYYRLANLVLGSESRSLTTFKDELTDATTDFNSAKSESSLMFMGSED